MSTTVGDVVKFFMLQSASLSHEIRTVFSDQISDIELSDNAVLTTEEVVSLLHKVESRMLLTVSSELKHIATLAGSLASQLMDQAHACGVDIVPVINELEEETRMQLVSAYHSQDSGLKPINAKLELKNLNAPQITKNVEDLQAKISALEAELSEKVQNTSQFKILQKMLQTKTTELEELEVKVQELENKIGK